MRQVPVTWLGRGQRVIGHGGDTQWFHTELALMPSEDLGVFVSYNTNTGGALSCGPFLEAFLSHYCPDPPPEGRRRGDLAKFAGTYQFNTAPRAAAGRRSTSQSGRGAASTARDSTAVSTSAPRR